GINIRGTMESQDAEAVPAGSVLQSKFITDSGLLSDGQKVTQGVDHHIANHENAAAGPAFFQEVLDGIFFCNKEIVSEGVSQDAVDLLGHGTVEAAEPRLDVGNADAKFGGGERNGDGGIDVANDENQVRLALDKNGFNAL